MKISLKDASTCRLDASGKSAAYLALGAPASVDRAILAELEAESERLGRKNVRLCLHSDPASSLHDMVVLIRGELYARPHKHKDKGESYHVLAGRAAALVFDDSGKVTDQRVLSPDGEFLYRLAPGVFHTLVPLTKTFIYHETRPGPFVPATDAIFPAWAPDGSKNDEGLAFLKGLLKP